MVLVALNVKLHSFSTRKHGWKKTHLILFVTRELHSCINKNIIFYAMPFSFRCHNDNESCFSLLVFVLFMLVALSFESCFFYKQSFHCFREWISQGTFYDIFKMSYNVFKMRYFWVSAYNALTFNYPSVCCAWLPINYHKRNEIEKYNKNKYQRYHDIYFVQ